ncbi:MAG: rRNA maturation RNase YbeY [Actinomycetota bacterium]|nr:rRNA maturation RNase YbeY [Actinomycetota bacterium]
MKVAVNPFCGGEIDTGALEKVCVEVLRYEEARRDILLSVTAVDEDEMRDLNRRFMKREGSTDVIAFPMGEESEEGYLLGDVIICPEVIMRHRDEYRVDEGRELEYVAAHGVLHLLGYEDGDAVASASMDLRQRKILHIEGERE